MSGAGSQISSETRDGRIPQCAGGRSTYRASTVQREAVSSAEPLPIADAGGRWGQRDLSEPDRGGLRLDCRPRRHSIGAIARDTLVGTRTFRLPG